MPRSAAIGSPPGNGHPSRFRGRHELLGCGIHGHELVGADIGQLRPSHRLIARDYDIDDQREDLKSRDPGSGLVDIQANEHARLDQGQVLSPGHRAYLLVSKRLFGIRGGGRIERQEREADTGWPVVQWAVRYLRDDPVGLAKSGNDPSGPSSARDLVTTSEGGA
jgi:hypothetical protein